MPQPEIKPHVDVVTLANHRIFTEEGAQIKVGQLWQRNPVVLIFLRHFGCVGCRGLAVQIWADKDKYQKNGARIAFIGNGAANFIRGFKEELKIQTAPVFTDPSLISFRACGFRRGFLAALGPKSLINGLQLMQAGHRNGPFEEGTGDYWQLGGVVAVRVTGEVSYHYISQALGDYPEELRQDDADSAAAPAT